MRFGMRDKPPKGLEISNEPQAALRDANFKVAPEVHHLFKLEAFARRITMKKFFVECFIAYLNINGSEALSKKDRFNDEADIIKFCRRMGLAD